MVSLIGFSSDASTAKIDGTREMEFYAGKLLRQSACFRVQVSRRQPAGCECVNMDS